MQSDSKNARLAFVNSKVVDLDTDIDSDIEFMGATYRTPSPRREGYISSSDAGSPQKTPEVIEIESSEYEEYQEWSQNRELEVPRHQDIFGTPSRDFGGTSNDVEVIDLSDEPRTPTKKQSSDLWHGLPSPDTPIFQYPLSSTSSADVSKTTDDTHGICEDVCIVSSSFSECKDVTTAQETMDAMLARELEDTSSPTTMRRSTRLRTLPKPKYNLQPLAAAPRTVPKLPPPPKQPEAEFTIVTIESDPISFEGLPSLHSTDWHLQYPPGGSTHPSYPYPNLDPRLIFHQSYVPIVNGLPDVKRLPDLVLPMGWEHVSWSGLLPIAFDPYRQAFKLTPVGPMPLTCEELHQGGLHKYVPGGELHPEYAMLPDMLKFSDGSDAEVYNFDGVGWTLPWQGNINFHPSTGDYCGEYSSDPATSNTSAFAIAYPWNEHRDCPNLVFDVSDAWRWLSTKETNPTADFVPSPDKKWFGTGAFRAKRKFKSPIAELLMLALQPTESSSVKGSSALLQNQDTLKTSNIFCPFKSVATPGYVDITLLGDTEFTLLELLSYFPQHYTWGHAAEHLSQAGVGPAVIRDIIIMTRGLKGDEIITSGSMSTATRAARRRDVAKSEEVDIDEVGKDTPTPMPPSIIDISTSYSAEAWSYDVWNKIDYPLLALTHGLQMLPSGPDAGPLTALILWCREKERYQVLLSDVPALLKEAGIEALIEPGDNDCPDKEVVKRHAEAMKKDRLRLVRDAGLAKRALDASEEKIPKRRRMK